MHLHLVRVEARLRHGQAQQPVDPDHTPPVRGERDPLREGMELAARANVVRLGALAGRTRPNVGVEAPGLARPVGEPAEESTAGLWRPAQRGVVALLQGAGPQTAPSGTQSRSACPCPWRQSKPQCRDTRKARATARSARACGGWACSAAVSLRLSYARGMLAAVIRVLRPGGHSRDGHLAGVGGDDGAAARVKVRRTGAVVRHCFSASKLVCSAGPQVPGGVRATQACQRGGNVSVALDESAARAGRRSRE